MPKFSHEILHRIYDDTTGDYLEIGPDADALDLIEIRAYTMVGAIGGTELSESVPKIVQRVTIPPESLDLVIAALTAMKKG